MYVSMYKCIDINVYVVMYMVKCISISLFEQIIIGERKGCMCVLGV